MKHFFLFFYVLLISSLFAIQAKGQSPELSHKLDKVPVFSPPKTGPLVYDQISHPSTATIVSTNFTDAGNLANTSFSADDFVVPTGETWNVSFVSVLGYNSVDPTYQVQSLNLYFYLDNGGMPGTAVYTFENLTGFNELPTSLEGVNLLEITLPSMASFTEGTYWICAQANCDYTQDGQWNWIFYDTPTTIGNEFHWKNPADGYGYGFTDWTTGSMVAWFPPYDLAFALYDEAYAVDLTAVELIDPQTGEGLTATETITVRVKNEALNEVTGFDISYSINGGNVITETVTGISINTNEFFDYSFSTPADLSSAGPYIIDIDVTITGDANIGNNHLTRTIYNLGTIYPLENGNTSQTITACSGTFTDPGGLYAPFNDTDFGTCTIYPASPGSMIRLSFLQWDAGWATFSIYNGEDISAPLIGTYDPNTGSPGIVTAVNSAGALTIAFQGSGWDHGEGWAAYMSCYNPPVNDLSVLNISVDVPAIFENMDVTFTAKIHNVGTLAQNKDVTFTANGLSIGSVSTGILQPYDTIAVSLLWTPSVAGVYLIEASVPIDLGQDDNNSKSFEKTVYPEGSLFESFEGQEFPPEFWSCKSFGKSEGYAYDGNFNAQIYVPYDFPTGDTLITPQLHIESGDQLTFAARSTAWWPGKLTLYWKDGTTGEWHLLEEIDLNLMQWQIFSVDLTPAAGNNFIGFHAWFNDPYSWGGQVDIDFITGIGPELYFVDHDLIAKKVEGEIVINQNQSVNYDINIKNIGAMNVAADMYTVKLMKETNSGPVELASTSGLYIESLKEKIYSFNVTLTEVENTAIYAEIDYSEDLKPENNQTVPLDISVKPEGTVHHIIGTGNDVTWSYPISSGQYELIQSIYYGSELQTPGVINGISLFYNNTGLNDLNDYPIQVWLVENDSIDVAGEWIPSTAMSLVYEGGINFRRGYHEAHIPFNNNFIYSGENIVFMINSLDNSNIPSIEFYYSTSPEVRTRYANDWALPMNDEDPSTYYANELYEYLNIKFSILPVDFGSITGVVYDESSNPIEGATISVDGYAGSKISNQNGEYAFDFMPAGSNQMTSVVFGYEDNIQTANVFAFQNTVLDFNMIPKPLITITGKVVGNNEPATGLENVEITLEGYTGYNVMTDMNGDFQISDVYGNESYTIAITHPDYVGFVQDLVITDQNIELGTITLTEILKVAFNIAAVGNATQLNLNWENPQTGLYGILSYDDSINDNGYTAEIGETVSIGNFMPIDGPATVTDFDIYFAKYVNGLSTPVTLEIYDNNQNLMFESEPFMTGIDEWVHVDIPNLSLSDDFYAMVKWDAPVQQSSYLGVSMYGGAPNYAYVAYPGQSFQLLSDLIGNDACMLIHARTIVPEPLKSKAVTEYHIYKGMLSDINNFGSWTMVSTVTGENFTDNDWMPSEPGDYVYAVEATYFGGESVPTFSNILNLTVNEPFNVAANVVDNDVTLNWDILQNQYVESYHIFLDDMQTPIGNTTESSYVIQNLPIGSYLAGISAVYPFGESAVIPVEFSIIVSGIEHEKSISISPNPAYNYLYITNVENSVIDIYNPIGMIVKSVKADRANFRMDIEDLPSGTYTMMIREEDLVSTYQICIVK